MVDVCWHVNLTFVLEEDKKMLMSWNKSGLSVSQKQPGISHLFVGRMQRTGCPSRYPQNLSVSLLEHEEGLFIIHFH